MIQTKRQVQALANSYGVVARYSGNKGVMYLKGTRPDIVAVLSALSSHEDNYPKDHCVPEYTDGYVPQEPGSTHNAIQNYNEEI